MLYGRLIRFSTFEQLRCEIDDPDAISIWRKLANVTKTELPTTDGLADHSKIRQLGANISPGSRVSQMHDATNRRASDRGNDDRRPLATQSGYDAIRRAFGEFALSPPLLTPGLS